MTGKSRLKRSRRLPTPVGRSLESGRTASDQTSGTHLLLKIGLALTLFAVTLFAFPRQQSYDLGVQIGSVWSRDDLVAPFQFAIFKPAEVLERERQEAEEATPSVARLILDAETRSLLAADSLRSRLNDLFAAYVAWQFEKQRRAGGEAGADSSDYGRLRAEFPVSLTDRQWRYLLTSHAARVPGLGVSSRANANQPSLDEQILVEVVGIVRSLLEQETIDVQTDSLPTEQVLVLNETDRTQRLLPRTSILGIDAIRTSAYQSLRERFGPVRDTVAIGLAFFNQVFRPRLVYLEDETAQRLERSRASVLETRSSVQEGEVIVRDGEVVSPEISLKLQSLRLALSDRSGNFRLWRMLLGQALLTLACYMVLFFFVHLFRPEIWNSTRDLSLILVLFILFAALFAGVVRLPFPHTPGLLVPVAMVPVLLTVIYDSRLAIVATVSLALLGGCIFGFDFEFAALTIFAGTLATFSVRGIRTRAHLMVTAGIVLLTYAVTISVFQLFQIFDLNTYLRELFLVVGNSVFLLLALPLLWIFERVFQVTTDVTLLELSDTNQPLLRELSFRAPGSFSHSLQVANLAEAAADAIGANALLTRVGALYHDIGKMLKPEYFVENQGADFNPHSQLTPKMSALVIAAHVKDGLDLARKWRLPSVIQDFIPMHHGSTRIEFFYQKALELNEDILESDFRYPGPRPQTKETGILMLADSVEAASKSVAGSGKPSPKRFEALVSGIIRARLDDGQLSACPLTFADLGRIKDTFVAMLSGMYHFRLRYPGQAEEEEPQEPAPALPPAEKGRIEAEARDGGEAGTETSAVSAPESPPEKGD